MTIFILAGGFGTRLKSLVADVPKPMADIKGKPFLTFHINLIRQHFPLATIYILTHYKSEVIEKYFEKDRSIKTIKENKPLGTGGSIKHAMGLLKLPKNEELLILNGDTYLEVNLTDFLNTAKGSNSILASFQHNCSRYGSLEIKNDIIVSFKEKDEKCRNSYINAGCYYFKDLEMFNTPLEVFSLEDKFKDYISQQPIFAYRYQGIFIDIGIPSDYMKMINYITKENNE